MDCWKKPRHFCPMETLSLSQACSQLDMLARSWCQEETGHWCSFETKQASRLRSSWVAMLELRMSRVLVRLYLVRSRNSFIVILSCYARLGQRASREQLGNGLSN